MNVTVLGAGNMGSALLKQLTRAGHKVRITARDAAKVKALVYLGYAGHGTSIAPTWIRKAA